MSSSGRHPRVVASQVTDANHTFAVDEADLVWRLTAAKSSAAAGARPVVIDRSVRHQTILGFGAAITRSTAIALAALPESSRRQILTELFDRERGLGLSVVRVPIGASDFSDHLYTYADQPDPALRAFSLQPDRDTVLPLLHEIHDIADDLQIIASPWSPPPWMKTQATMWGRARATLWRHGPRLPWSVPNRLAPRHYGTYANYLVRYVQAMATEGLPVRALTVQNEPGHDPRYPGMVMSVEEQAQFIGRHLGPALAAARSTTRILAHDHNWADAPNVLQLLDDADAARFISGIAWHAYRGTPDAQTQVHDAHPELETHLTEITSHVAPRTHAVEPLPASLWWHMRSIAIGATAAGAQSVVYWNLALDGHGGVRIGETPDTLQGVIDVDARTAEVTRQVGYYSLAHLSAVQRGAVRVNIVIADGAQPVDDVFGPQLPENPSAAGAVPTSDAIRPLSSTDTTQVVAFENPDGTLVVLAAAAPGHPDTLDIQVGGWATTLTLAGGQVRTLHLQTEQPQQ